MLARISFGLIAIFWLTMNVLLWRSEYGSRDPEGDVIPVNIVWRKILTSPDSSSLTIWRDKERLGFCHWVSSVGEEFATLEEAPPEGMMNQMRSYQIKVDGNIALREHNLRLRFEFNLKLSTNQNWQEFTFRLGARPASVELHGIAAEQALHVHSEDGDSQTDRVIKFSDLANPQALASQFSAPSALGIPAVLGAPALGSASPALNLGLKWEARSQMYTIGREPVRVYRLKSRLLDRYDIVVYVSRAGELLRVELPGNITMIQEQLVPR